MSHLTDLLSGEKDIMASAVILLLEHMKETCKPDAEKSLVVNSLNEKLMYYVLPRYVDHLNTVTAIWWY